MIARLLEDVAANRFVKHWWNHVVKKRIYMTIYDVRIYTYIFYTHVGDAYGIMKEKKRKRKSDN